MAGFARDVRGPEGSAPRGAGGHHPTHPCIHPGAQEDITGILYWESDVTQEWVVMGSVTGEASDVAREIALRAWSAGRGIWLSEETREALAGRDGPRLEHVPDGGVRVGGRQVALHEISLG